MVCEAAPGCRAWGGVVVGLRELVSGNRWWKWESLSTGRAQVSLLRSREQAGDLRKCVLLGPGQQGTRRAGGLPHRLQMGHSQTFHEEPIG
jgi:hypothetical protein